MSCWSDEVKKIFLQKVAKIYSGFAFYSKDLSSIQGIPVIKIANIQNKRVLATYVNYFPSNLLTKKHDKYFLHKNDILIAMTGAGSVGRVGKMRQLCQSCLVNQRVAIVRPQENIDAEFLYQVLSLDRYENEMYNLGMGAGQPNVSATDIGKLTIPYPPLTVQRRIASILGAYDDLIENNTRRIKLLEQMAQRVYRQWFVDFKFPGYENAKFIDSPLGKIPQGWEVVSLAQFGKVITGKTPSTKRSENFGSFMPFIKTPDMHNNIFCIETKENLSEIGVISQQNKILPENSLCVSCIGTAGVVSITGKPSQTNQQINSIIPDKSLYREYLYYILVYLKQTIKSYGANGATMVNLNKSKFESLEALLPNEALLLKFHEQLKSSFDCIKILQIKNQNLRRTRDLLLPKLINGEIGV